LLELREIEEEIKHLKEPHSESHFSTRKLKAVEFSPSISQKALKKSLPFMKWTKSLKKKSDDKA
jgi:hypothetical protein